MKIKCIDNWYNLCSITINKIYNIINTGTSRYRIKNDLNRENWYPKCLFDKPLFEIRNEKIDKLLEDE
jgi:hypothetical protein